MAYCLHQHDKSEEGSAGNPDKKEKEARISELDNKPDLKSKLELNDTLIKVLKLLKKGYSYNMILY